MRFPGILASLLVFSLYILLALLFHFISLAPSSGL